MVADQDRLTAGGQDLGRRRQGAGVGRQGPKTIRFGQPSGPPNRSINDIDSLCHPATEPATASVIPAERYDCPVSRPQGAGIGVVDGPHQLREGSLAMMMMKKTGGLLGPDAA
jgi:hypothetical protein